MPEAKYLCERCAVPIENYDPRMVDQAALACSIVINDRRIPMWKRVIFGVDTTRFILCRNCLVEFDKFIHSNGKV